MNKEELDKINCDLLLHLSYDEFLKRDSLLPKFISSLKKFAKDFMKSEYDLDLKIPIKVISNKTNRQGRYKTVNGKPNSITINKNAVQVSHLLDLEFAENILKHELVHHAFHVLGKPYSDGDVEFEQELSRVGAPSSNAVGALEQDYKLETYIPMDVIYITENKTGNVIAKNRETHKPSYPDIEGNIKRNGKLIPVKGIRKEYIIITPR